MSVLFGVVGWRPGNNMRIIGVDVVGWWLLVDRHGVDAWRLYVEKENMDRMAKLG